ncbi:MAG: dTDP-4-dehydrorhamnose 3,5-epimerase [Gammaproteobacteria bacterium]
MEFLPTAVPDVILIKPHIFGDARGFFMETWEQRKFAAVGIDARFVQDNHSKSVRHTLRGLHYQITQPQGKLVRVVAGEIFDVAVDIRRSSISFGKWVGMILSAADKHELWVPEGFAHGFMVLSESAEVIYKCTDFWAPEHERCILWNDPQLAIEWPLSSNAEPVMSEKDRRGRFLSDAELFS